MRFVYYITFYDIQALFNCVQYFTNLLRLVKMTTLKLQLILTKHLCGQLFIFQPIPLREHIITPPFSLQSVPPHFSPKSKYGSKLVRTGKYIIALFWTASSVYQGHISLSYSWGEVPHPGIFLSGGQGGHCPPLNFDNPKRSRIWEAYVVVRLAAT